MKKGSTKPVRCAIYTRVSTDHGLEQDFNSLDAQYDAAQAYIRSQAHAGWALIRSRYDDGGYSGGSTERPALQRLLADVRARKVDVIVVYKVDRLTRSLADFAKLVELFDGHGVSFVSITQQFNTTTSMGRLTLNVLLSFAQFEREVTSERIRDKIAASKRKGLWVGGIVPLGYATRDRKIVVVAEEAERVRTIFRRYLELGSLNLLMADLRERGIATKMRSLKTGRTIGGIPFTRGPLAHLLRNRFYIGEVVFKGEVLPGEQPAILAQTHDVLTRESWQGRNRLTRRTVGRCRRDCRSRWRWRCTSSRPMPPNTAACRAQLAWSRSHGRSSPRPADGGLWCDGPRAVDRRSSRRSGKASALDAAARPVGRDQRHRHGRLQAGRPRLHDRCRTGVKPAAPPRGRRLVVRWTEPGRAARALR